MDKIARKVYTEYHNNESNVFECGVNCVAIMYHEPIGEGDSHYCDVLHSDGVIQRIFKPNYVVFEGGRKDEI
jgi:hypothetical protein